jgi:hypothetical protein
MVYHQASRFLWLILPLGHDAHQTGGGFVFRRHKSLVTLSHLIELRVAPRVI